MQTKEVKACKEKKNLFQNTHFNSADRTSLGAERLFIHSSVEKMQVQDW